MRDHGRVFEAIAGRQVDLHIEDPWCVARTQNTERLERYLAMLKKLGMQVRRLTLVWEPEIRPDVGERAQGEEIERWLRRKGLYGQLRHEPSDRRRRQHFPDRFVEATTVDDRPTCKVRYDITSEIGNLMAYQKECSVFATVDGR